MAGVKEITDQIRKAGYGKEVREPIAEACERIYHMSEDEPGYIADGATAVLDEAQEENLKNIKKPFDTAVRTAEEKRNDALEDAETRYLLADDQIDTRFDQAKSLSGIRAEDSEADALAIFENGKYPVRKGYEWAIEEGQTLRDSTIRKAERIANAQDAEDFDAEAIYEENAEAARKAGLHGQNEVRDQYNEKLAEAETAYGDALDEIREPQQERLSNLWSTYSEAKAETERVHNLAAGEAENAYNEAADTIEPAYDQAMFALEAPYEKAKADAKVVYENADAAVQETYDVVKPVVAEKHTEAVAEAKDFYDRRSPEIREEYDQDLPRIRDREDEIVDLETLLNTRVVEMTPDPMETWYTYDYELTPVQLQGDDYRIDSIRAEITTEHLEDIWYQVSDSKAEDGVQAVSERDYIWTMVNPPIAEHIHHGRDHMLVIVRNNERVS